MLLVGVHAQSSTTAGKQGTSRLCYPVKRDQLGYWVFWWQIPKTESKQKVTGVYRAPEHKSLTGLSNKEINSWWKVRSCRPGAETLQHEREKGNPTNPYHIWDDLGLFGWSWPLLFNSQLQDVTELLSSLKGRRLSGFILPSTVQWLLPHLLCTVEQKAGRITGNKYPLSRFLQAGQAQACDCIPATQLEGMMPCQLAGLLEQWN